MTKADAVDAESGEDEIIEPTVKPRILPHSTVEIIDIEKSKKFLGLDVVSTTVGGVGTPTNPVVAAG